MDQTPYPVQFSVDYPDRQLDRMSTLFRIFAVIPIMLVLGAVSGGAWQTPVSDRVDLAGANERTVFVVIASGGVLFAGPLLMILFRQKYPRWWFDWNLELLRFSSRVGAYLALMDDQYPSTDDHQAVHLEYVFPDVPRDLNRWLPLVKWFLAIPHYIALFFLNIAMILAVIGAWFAILVTGQYPRGLFTFVEGVMRWNHRVTGYALTLITDHYPPFRLTA